MAHARTHLGLLLGAASAALAFSAASAIAQDAPIETRDQRATAEEIVVPGVIAYRNRSEEIAPVLEYGLDYFQRFEPLTVGDMLKRTPSATFVSDVLEFDGVRLRGLDPGYTQVLINGERTPGSGLDRSFFVDRIPAELVERVEIVRSSSANRSGDAVAGALNIVLRDSYSFDGGFVRAGGLYFNDEEIEPVIGGVFSGPLGPGRILLGANIQGRHNPKEKVSYRYEPDGGVLEFDNREDQSDVRDGTDYTFNAEYTLPVGQGELQLSGFYVRTDRTETELSREYTDETSIDIGDLDSETPQFEDILQDNYSLELELTQPMFGGETQFEIGLARFEESVDTLEEETVFDGDAPEFYEFGGTLSQARLNDTEWSFELSHERSFGAAQLEFGVDVADKERDASLFEAESELEEQFADDDVDEENPLPYAEGTPIPPYGEFEAVAGGVYLIEELRIDPYVMLSGEAGLFEWELGVRYETTESKITDFEEGASYTNEYEFVLPSAHLRVNLTDRDRLSFSVARTLRRPNFDYLSPTLLEEEPTEDNDFVGNPLLDPENAWGVDAGYERRIGRTGVAGINLFYRDVKDVIELTSTGDVSSSGDGFIFTPQNVGDGSVWGVELDFSAPLTIFGLENTGVFLNYSWLDSDITDPVTGESRRFNDQAESVFNIGFIQDIPSWAAAFGASYRQQGDAFNRVLGETVETTYGGDLEIFVEKRFGENFTLRFTGSNLLDLEKEETFFKWDTLADQLSGDIDALDEFELESENSGPVFQLVGRMAF
ncbi:MAG: TonB-dependent receptor plug domain-containing protein [Hyphomonadaceae bacterium]